MWKGVLWNTDQCNYLILQHPTSVLFETYQSLNKFDPQENATGLSIVPYILSAPGWDGYSGMNKALEETELSLNPARITHWLY